MSSAFRFAPMPSRIAPQAVAGVTSASGWFDTPKGRITVSWKIMGGQLQISKRIPPNVKVVAER